MKLKKILLSLLAIAFIFSAFAFVKTGPTETVCHFGKSLKVFKSAVAAHLAHGDTLGECE